METFKLNMYIYYFILKTLAMLFISKDELPKQTIILLLLHCAMHIIFQIFIGSFNMEKLNDLHDT